jgi:putative transposase
VGIENPHKVIMAIVNYTYKFRLSPNKEQRVLLAKHFGCQRFIYNHFLRERIDYYLGHKENDSEKKSLNYYDQANKLTKLKKEYVWLKEPNSQSLQFAITCLETAYNNFFNGRARFPKFKKKHGKQSFTAPQSVEIRNGKLSIPKFKKGIKCKFHREIVGEIKTCTISRNPSGQYHASILVERDIKKLPKLKKSIGVDLGIKTLAVCSDGTKYENIKPYRTLEKRLAKLQRWFSRTTKGTNLHEKVRRKIAKLYQHITNIRDDYLHKISRRLVDENQIICLEDLNVKGMLANRKQSKSVWDCSWSKLITMIKYKAEWYGREVAQISRWFPSSKTCNVCHYVKDDLTLKDREWLCPKCGTNHDRDFNASLNIEQQGLNLLNRRNYGGRLGTGSTMKVDFNPLLRHSGMKQEAPSL